MTPCPNCGISNPIRERHPHPDIVRAELAAMIRERWKQQRADHKRFQETLRHNMRYELDQISPLSMTQFTQQQLLAGERIIREQTRQNGGTVTN